MQVAPQINQEKLASLHRKLALYSKVEERERCEESLTEFVQTAWTSVDSSTFQPSWALDAMCDHLEAVTLGQIPRLLINIPPRCSKTTVASICWPAWVWARSIQTFWSGPKVKFLCGSYNAPLALGSANKMRRLTLSPWYQGHWGGRFNLTQDQNTKSDFDNDKGGARQSTSVGGSLLGLGGDIIICLPYKERVLTDRGLLPIGEIVTERLQVKIAGLSELGTICWQTIEKYEKNPGNRIVEITWKGGSLRCTADHHVFVWGRGYVPAETIDEDDLLYGSDLDKKVVTSVKEVGWEEQTYNLRVEPCHNYFAEGILVHNCDDPHNTETEKVVETDADRNKVASWWKELSSTRLNSPKESAIVVVMQRLHEQDLSGVILDSDDEDWVHLMIPMRHDVARHNVTVKLPQYSDEEPWEDPRVEEDELMWPERFGEVEVKRIESRLGPYMAAGRLQQAPVPKGGGIIKRDWWQTWDAQEAQRYGLEWSGERKEFPQCELVVASLDTSYGEKQENDYNALTVWGIWQDRNKNRRAMLMFAWRKRLPLHGKLTSALPNEPKLNFDHRQKEAWGLVEWVADTCRRYKVKRLLIEDKTRGRDVAQEITRLYARENWAPELLQPIGDKVSRTHSVVPLFTDGCVWAPDTRWSDLVIQESQSFPKAPHDDLHDTVTQFLSWSRENGLLIRGDEASAALEDENAYKPPVRSVAAHYGI